MKSSVAKRSIVIGEHKTSISLEDPFWADLKNIAHSQQVTLSELVTAIDRTGDPPVCFSPRPLWWRQASGKLVFPQWVLKAHQQASCSHPRRLGRYTANRSL